MLCCDLRLSGISKITRTYLIFDGGDDAPLTIVKSRAWRGKIPSREDRSLVRISRDTEPSLLLMVSEVETLLELRGSEIGELGNAMDRARIQELVALSAVQVSLENRESIIVLLLRGVSLAILFLEE